MSRKSLILCLSVLGVVLVLIGAAVAVLYSGNENAQEGISDDGPSVLSAVPADALFVSCGKAGGLLSLSDALAGQLKRCDAAVSLHFSGKLHSLGVIDVRKAGTSEQNALREYLADEGKSVAQEGSLLLFSSSENILKSAVRHLAEGVSVMDAPGFRTAYESVKGQDILLIPGQHARRLMTSMFTSRVYKHAPFLSKITDWYAFRVREGHGVSLSGNLIYEGEPDELMTAFEGCIPGVSGVADYLPSYTLYAVTLPMANQAAFRKDFQVFADSRGNLKAMQTKQAELKKKNGISPEELFDRLNVKELATAGMMIRSRLEKVLLIHIDSKDAGLIFQDPSIKTLRGYVSKLHQWKYQSYVSSVYGSMFAIADESCFTYRDGWLIVGSRSAIDEYVTHNALEYTLSEYVAHAGKKTLLSASPAVAVAYFSLTAEKNKLSDYMSKSFVNGINAITGEPEYCPVVFSISRNEDSITSTFDIHGLTLARTKAPSTSRDTTVIIPKGPFPVFKSADGKSHKFYQNEHKSLCLKDENGKNLWGVPFDKTICGTAHDIDVHNNGRTQIIFGAGSSLYVIERSGRYMTGFPLDLKKEICLGPDVYDISGLKCAAILHKDNTLELYALPKGKRPSFWHTIDLDDETIKSLPEKLTVGQKDYWIVRTAIQTLIYPVGGGKPLTKFKDDAKIRPDSEVLVLEEENAVEVSCYDGKKRTVNLK